ncbi:hypothetical protein ACFOWE_29440 [Planomonospora corallina]|uniref:Uncharacterized protein n=1 Tax=Planomonospora corallina TaxID=1806052 RepID=A0ABV8IDY7_9ACTN
MHTREVIALTPRWPIPSGRNRPARHARWIKGTDNGIMDEPTVTIFVEGTRENVTGGAA